MANLCVKFQGDWTISSRVIASLKNDYRNINYVARDTKDSLCLKVLEMNSNPIFIYLAMVASEIRKGCYVKMQVCLLP